MKRSLNDSLRLEFKEILEIPDYQDIIQRKNLEMNVIKGAFEKLITADRFLEAQPEDIEKARSEFENYIINTLKTKKHSDDN